MVAQLTNLEARELIISIGNAHLYENQLEPAKEQIKRKPFKFPKLVIDQNIINIDNFRAEHFQLIDYQAHPHIKAPLVIL
jgi:thymidylate synthase